MQKGQYIRLFLGDDADSLYVLAAAKEMQLHLSAQTEDSTTKDTTATWQEFEVTGQSYEITGNSLVLTPSDSLNTDANSLSTMLSAMEGNASLYWRISVVSGTNNRTEETVLLSGTCTLTQLQLDGQNKQNATYSYTLKGVGDIAVAS